MKTLWNESSRRELKDRLGRLQADAKSLWGRMNAPRMLAYIGSALRMAKGEHPAFGKMTSKAWGVPGYRHLDHHFKQFGV